MRRSLCLAALLFACIGSASAEPIYKWVDARGATHFSAQPPQGSAASLVPHAKQPPAAPTPSQTPATPTAQAPSQAEIDARVREDVAKKEKELADYCTTVRTTLAQLRNNPRLRVEEKGEVRRVPEEERQARIAEAEKAIAEHCQ